MPLNCDYHALAAVRPSEVATTHHIYPLSAHLNCHRCETARFAGPSKCDNRMLILCTSARSSVRTSEVKLSKKLMNSTVWPLSFAAPFGSADSYIMILMLLLLVLCGCTGPTLCVGDAEPLSTSGFPSMRAERTMPFSLIRSVTEGKVAPFDMTGCLITAECYKKGRLYLRIRNGVRSYERLRYQTHGYVRVLGTYKRL